MTTNATKRTCACGCGVFLSAYSNDDMTWQCRERTAAQAAGAEEYVAKKKEPLHSRESLLAAITAYVDEHGRPPTTRDCGANGLPARTVYTYYFGTWARALKAVGLKPRYIGRPRNSPARKKVLEALDKGMTMTGDISNAIGVSEPNVRRILNIMRAEGGVYCVKPPRGSGNYMPRTLWYRVERGA